MTCRCTDSITYNIVTVGDEPPEIDGIEYIIKQVYVTGEALNCPSCGETIIDADLPKREEA